MALPEIKNSLTCIVQMSAGDILTPAHRTLLCRGLVYLPRPQGDGYTLAKRGLYGEENLKRGSAWLLGQIRISGYTFCNLSD